jgi:hypothetical protein
MGSLGHASAAHATIAQQLALKASSVHALWVTGAMVVGVSIVQGLLTGFSGYQA